jgi:hypothetical protein
MWKPQPLTNLWASTACYRDNFTFFYLLLHHNNNNNNVTYLWDVWLLEEFWSGWLYLLHLYIQLVNMSVFFCGVGLTPPLGPFFRSPRFRFLRSLCSSPLGPCKSQYWATHWPIVHSPDDIWGWLWSNWWSERRLQGKPKNSEKPCPSATLSHHKSHMPRSGFEPRTAALGSQRLTA